MTLRGFGLALAIAFFGAAACSVYDDSLLAPLANTSSGSGGASDASGSTGMTTVTSGGGMSATSGGGKGGSSTSTSTSGAGGCMKPADCPGMDSECASRTCDANVCGSDDKADGAMLVAQTAGDCQVAECDGKGGMKSVVDESDVPDDMLDCTDDACAAGVPSNVKHAVGTACIQNGGSFCDSNGLCVECLKGADCMSKVCDPNTNKCVAASCLDKTKNAAETDIDCGGGMCPGCPTGDGCIGNGDCLGMVCVNMFCQASCADGMKNNGETDVDCGGPACNPCPYGEKCGAGTDCATGNCTSGVCACGGNHLVISEIKTRGALGGSDEFVELYNPTPSPVVLDSSWQIYAKTYNGANYVLKWAGVGQTVPPYKHFLITGTAYMMAAMADINLSSGIGDAAGVILTHGVAGGTLAQQAAATVDAVCFQYNANTLALLGNAANFICEGTPVSNLPHNDAVTPASDTDVSLERKPGGAAGNCVDTQDNSKDFQSLTPPNPQGLAAPATP